MASNTYTGDTTVDAGVLKALALTSTGSTIMVGSDSHTATLAVNYIRAHSLVLKPGSTVVLGGVSALASGADTGGNVLATYVSGAMDTAAANSVPEPSTFTIFGVGAAALLFFGLRWRKHTA